MNSQLKAGYNVQRGALKIKDEDGHWLALMLNNSKKYAKIRARQKETPQISLKNLRSLFSIRIYNLLSGLFLPIKKTDIRAY